MEFFTPLSPENASSLGMALVISSPTPLILLDDALVVQVASESFCRSFGLNCAELVASSLFTMGHGEWDIPQLRILLQAAASGLAPVDAYEVDLRRDGKPTRTLILNAHILDYSDNALPRLALAITDVTDTRTAQREKDALVQEKQVLLQELNHRVANSLQIIASVLMQRVRSVQSEEARVHLRDAHHRVMSVATLQRQLASTADGDVRLRPYLTDLCASIGASMIAEPGEQSLSVVVDDSVMSSDRSVSVGLIVTELVINALKHAYPDGAQGGNIKVAFASTPLGWVLTVADDGIGFPGDHAHAKSGLGTGIVNALAGQLAATVAVSNASPGTLISVTHVTGNPSDGDLKLTGAPVPQEQATA